MKTIALGTTLVNTLLMMISNHQNPVLLENVQILCELNQTQNKSFGPDLRTLYIVSQND